jgi:hypothetical protein
MVRDYIQWYLDSQEMNEVTEPFLNFARQTQEIRRNTSLNFYKQKVLTQFYGNMGEMDKYMAMASAVVGNKHFQQSLNNAVDAMAMPDLSNVQVARIQGIQQDLKRNAENYSKLITQINNAVNSIVNVLGTADLDFIPPKSAEAGGVSTDSIHAAIKTLYGSHENYNRIITKRDFESLDNRFKGQYGYLLSLLPDFTELHNAYLDGSQKVASDTSLKILSRILLPIQTLTGICNEYQVEIEANKLLSDMEKSLNNGNSITIKRVGDDGRDRTGHGFSTGTADLTIKMNQGQSHVNFTVPDLGVSLKRTRQKKTGKLDIKLKGTNLGQLMYELNPDLVTKFYTILANDRPTVNDKKQADFPSGTVTNAYSYMRNLALVPALVGNFDVDDLVSIFVVNNKAVTIYDLLEELGKLPNDKYISTKPGFGTVRSSARTTHRTIFDKYTPDEKQKRSREIRAFLDKISMEVYLKIEMSLLNKI